MSYHIAIRNRNVKASLVGLVMRGRGAPFG